MDCVIAGKPIECSAQASTCISRLTCCVHRGSVNYFCNNDYTIILLIRSYVTASFLPFFGAAIQAWVDTYNKIFVNIFKYNLAFSFILVHIIHISLSKYPLLHHCSCHS